VDCHGSSLIRNTLESWDVTNGSKPVKQHDLPFGKPNETVRGSLFDTERQVAFAITARQIDPMYALSFADVKDLKVLSEVDGLSGDINVFRFIQDRKFLIGIGRDTSGSCTGFGPGWSSSKVAVSIIDVQNLNKIRLVQRDCVAVQGNWSSSEVNVNRDQAHKMIGMHSSNGLNVITVPVYYYNRSSQNGWWYYRYETAVGMMAWDLSKYDPTKSHLEQTVLSNFGTVIHPKGQVKRSILFTHGGPQKHRMMVNLSNTHISVVDVENLGKPVQQAMIEVAPYQGQIYRFGNYAVEHINQGAYEPYSYTGTTQFASEFRVKKLSKGTRLEEQPEVASFIVGQVEKVVKYKNNLVLFRRVKNESGSGYPYYNYYDTEVQIWDLSNPENPVRKGTLKTGLPILPYYYYWCGNFGYWGGYWFDPYYRYGYSSDAWTVTDRGMTFLLYIYDYTARGYVRKLAFLDLTNTATPAIHETMLTANTDYGFYGVQTDRSDPKAFYLTYRVKVGTAKAGTWTLYKYKYYAQQWVHNGSAWTPEPPVNLPGRLVKTWVRQGTRLYLTQDFTYKKKTTTSGYAAWVASYRLNLLQHSALYLKPTASLLDWYHFQDMYLRDLVLDGDKLFVNGRYSSYYNSYSPTATLDQNSDHLMLFNLSALRLTKTYGGATGTYNTRLMGTYKGLLFVNLPGDGILVVDSSNMAAPSGRQFMRTLGYATHLEFGDDVAYIAAGYFGIYQMDLGLTTSKIPTS
jgi:hypothetical protein